LALPYAGGERQGRPPRTTADKARRSTVKKTILLALLLASVTAAAHAVPLAQPAIGKWYVCFYDSSYPGPAANPGNSLWTTRVAGSPTLLYTYETFTVPSGGPAPTDTYRAAWAWKSDDTFAQTSKWEFTFNPNGPQCKNTVVTLNGSSIAFNECTDGHSRVCYKLGS
jgi:hypothetical protein